MLSTVTNILSDLHKIFSEHYLIKKITFYIIFQQFYH